MAPDKTKRKTLSLPHAYEVRRKVVFTGVCLLRGGGRVSPSPVTRPVPGPAWGQGVPLVLARGGVVTQARTAPWPPPTGQDSGYPPASQARTGDTLVQRTWSVISIIAETYCINRLLFLSFQMTGLPFSVTPQSSVSDYSLFCSTCCLSYSIMFCTGIVLHTSRLIMMTVTIKVRNPTLHS